MHRVTLGSLDNGIRTVLIHRPHLHRAVVTVLVGVGSRYETPRNNGLSHLLEHMFFRGTRRHPDASALNEAIEGLGGDLVATTHADYTLFELSVPPDGVERACKLLGAMLSRPTFSQLEVEKQIVREEIIEDLDDDGHVMQPDVLTRAQVFANHPLGLPLTGTLANVASFDTADLRAHLRRHYVGGNMVVAVCSPEPIERIAPLVAQGFRRIKEGVQRMPKPLRTRQQRARIGFVPRAGSQTCLRLAFATPGGTSREARAVELITRVLHDGMSTRLHRRLCDELGLAYVVTAGVELFRDVGLFDVGTSVAHDSVPRVMEEVLTMLGDLAIDGPTQAELKKVQHRYAFDLASLGDDPTALAREYGSATLLNLPLDLQALRAQSLALTPALLRAAAARVFSASGLNLTLVGDLDPEQLHSVRNAIRRFRVRLQRANTLFRAPPARVLSRPTIAQAAMNRTVRTAQIAR
ncbi:MAG: pitrilysin family protein [Deltaproteobacteria bacterium]|nr:pitrilysin family protein [Deltaproteobacteria bacterium]